MTLTMHWKSLPVKEISSSEIPQYGASSHNRGQALVKYLNRQSIEHASQVSQLTMDKLISFFQPEKRKVLKTEEEVQERVDIQVTEDRRKWSISRSGRMKQANKKRHSVAKDLYGEACGPVEKPTSVEYHVNANIPAKPAEIKIDDRSEVSPSEPKSPEEEIESAFEILDKVDKLEKAS